MLKSFGTRIRIGVDCSSPSPGRPQRAAVDLTDARAENRRMSPAQRSPFTDPEPLASRCRVRDRHSDPKRSGSGRATTISANAATVAKVPTAVKPTDRAGATVTAIAASAPRQYQTQPAAEQPRAATPSTPAPSTFHSAQLERDLGQLTNQEKTGAVQRREQQAVSVTKQEHSGEHRDRADWTVVEEATTSPTARTTAATPVANHARPAPACASVATSAPSPKPRARDASAIATRARVTEPSAGMSSPPPARVRARRRLPTALRRCQAPADARATHHAEAARAGRRRRRPR